MFLPISWGRFETDFVVMDASFIKKKGEKVRGE
jgi:hypothetical protein